MMNMIFAADPALELTMEHFTKKASYKKVFEVKCGVSRTVTDLSRRNIFNFYGNEIVARS